MPNDDGYGPSRRELIAALGAGGVAATAGCMGLFGGDDTPTPAPQDTDEPSDGGDGSGESTPSDAVSGTFVAGTTTEAPSIHPWDVDDAAVRSRLSLLYDGGGALDRDGNVEGFWFSSWSLSDEKDVVTYELRDNLQWGAGYGQVTAEDYRYCVENAWQVDDNWSNFPMTGAFTIDGTDISYETDGTLTLTAQLPEPRFGWKHEDPLLRARPVPKSLLQKYAPGEGGGSDGDPDGFRNDSAITGGRLSGNLGAFSLEEWNRGSRMTLSRTDDYYLRSKVDAYADAPLFEGLEYVVFDDETAGYEALRDGDLTRFPIAGRDRKRLANTRGIRLWHSTFGDRLYPIALNHRTNAWPRLREEQSIRQGLAHVIDPSVLITQIYEGNANPLETFHPPWGPYSGNVQRFDYSVEKAKDKLTAPDSDLFYRDSDGRLIDYDNGGAVDLTMVVRDQRYPDEIVGVYVRQQLKKAGIDVSLDRVSERRLYRDYLQNSADNVAGVGSPRWRAGPYNGGPYDESVSNDDWDLLFGVGFPAHAHDPWNLLTETLAERGRFNAWGYTTDQFQIRDNLLKAATAAKQGNASGPISSTLSFLSKDRPMLWAFNPHRIIGFDDSIEGLNAPRNAFVEPSPERKLRFAQGDSG